MTEGRVADVQATHGMMLGPPSPYSALLGTVHPPVVEIESLAVSEAGSEIVGYVIDTETGEPVAGEVVRLDGGAFEQPYTTRTNERGGYGFGELAPGSYVISLGSVGVRVDVGAHERARASFPVSYDAGALIVMGGLEAWDFNFARMGPHLLDIADP